jgi:hypothetical protein
MNTAMRDAIFGLGSFIRYVAFGDGQRVETAQRDGIADASDVGNSQTANALHNARCNALSPAFRRVG